MSLSDGTAWEKEYGTLEPLDLSNTSGHAHAWFTSPLANVYEYDPAADGPEVKAITRIRAKHALYTPGKEAELLRFQRFVDRVARSMYGDRYGRLGLKRRGHVLAEVIFLHSQGERFVRVLTN